MNKAIYITIKKKKHNTKNIKINKALCKYKQNCLYYNFKKSILLIQNDCICQNKIDESSVRLTCSLTPPPLAPPLLCRPVHSCPSGQEGKEGEAPTAAPAGAAC